MQWTAFLTLSCPYFALKDSGFRYFAISGSWGPTNSLNEATAFSYLISRATEGPFEICSIIGKYSGSIPLYTS